MKYGLHVMLIGSIGEGLRPVIAPEALQPVRAEAIRISRYGLWINDYEYIPPSQIKRVLVVKKS